MGDLSKSSEAGSLEFSVLGKFLPQVVCIGEFLALLNSRGCFSSRRRQNAMRRIKRSQVEIGFVFESEMSARELLNVDV